MSFVGKHDVNDVASIVPHGRDDLIALRLFYTYVVRALDDHQRRADLICFEEWRARAQEIGFIEPPEPFVEHSSEGGPVGRNAFHQRDEVRRTEEIDAAGEYIGRERDAHERRITAVAAAENADPFRIDVALMDGPVEPIEQIGMHLSGPFAVAGIQILLPVTGRAAE